MGQMGPGVRREREDGRIVLTIGINLSTSALTHSDD
jgi:hypothetical protein